MYEYVLSKANVYVDKMTYPSGVHAFFKRTYEAAKVR